MCDSSALMRSLRSSGSSSSMCLHENWLPLAPQLLEPVLRSPEAIQFQYRLRLAGQPPEQSPGNLASSPGAKHQPLRPQEPLPRALHPRFYEPSRGARVFLGPE
jgi:hypothetical protein